MSFSISDNNLEVFRLVVDQAPDAIIFADRQGMIQVWNKAAADLFGFLADEVIGLSLDIIIPEHLRHAHWEGFGRAVASGQTKHGRRALKTRATHKDGQRLYVSLAFSVVNDREGKVIGAMATARKFIEDPDAHQLRAAEKKGQRVGVRAPIRQHRVVALTQRIRSHSFQERNTNVDENTETPSFGNHEQRQVAGGSH